MDEVTDEVLLIIFRYLTTEELVCIHQVCRRFNRVASDPVLYRKISYSNTFPLSSKILQHKLWMYSDRIQSLNLQDCFWIPPAQLLRSLQKCQHLKELILIDSQLSIAGLVTIGSNNPNLVRLGWSIPSRKISSELNKDGLPTKLFHEVQGLLKRLNGILLRFESLVSFEQFLPIFDTTDLFVEEFGLEYLSERTSTYFTVGNNYGIYVKCKKQFQICLSNAIDANRFLHFNLLVMDFVIQTVTKAAEASDILVLLAPGNINSPCWKYITPVMNSVCFQKIDMSYCTLDKEQMTWLSKLKNVTHLNLSDVTSFKANLMKLLAANCTDLKALNLCHNDDWIEKDLHGLDAVANHCSTLTELNLSCLHIHASHDYLNRLCSIVSKIKKLEALSIPACALVNNISINEQNDTVGKSVLQRKNSFSYKPQVTSNLLLNDESSSSCDSTDFSRKLRSSYEDQVNTSTDSGLFTILDSCKCITTLEIIDTGFHSAFSKISAKQDQFSCPTTAYLKDAHFIPVSTLLNLKKLTLAGLSGVGSFNSLSQITKSCCQLEDLSIAHCGLSGHANSLSSLKQALCYCHKLKKLRLDQPYFVLRDHILETLHNCKRLQILCIISKNGKAPKEPENYISLFNECPRLVSFFLFTGLLVPDAKKIQSTIYKRYNKERPPLCATVLPYFNALTEEGLQRVPYVYLRDVIRFESRVASCKYDST